MEIVRRIKEFASRFGRVKKLDSSFVFPYSTDAFIKRQQVWDNLQNGLLFEDRRILIPWLTPFNRFDNFSERRQDSGDRILWYLGKRTVLDGYEGHFQVKKWIWIPWTYPITEISEYIGQDYEGMKNFYHLRDHLENLLGDPIKIELEKFGPFDLGEICWQNGLIKVSLIGIEIFSCRYIFSIGLADTSLIDV